MESILKKLVGSSAESMSGGAGALIGLSVAGAPGALGGAMLAPYLELGLKELLSDIGSRTLSVKESKRVGTAAVHALNRICERIIAGDKPREDAFFQGLQDDRSPAETVFEGALMVSRLQWEEKKVPWIGNIYANAVFSNFSPEIINRVLILAERMTWQQLKLTAIVGVNQNLNWMEREEIEWMANWKNKQFPEQKEYFLIHECIELFQFGFKVLDRDPIRLTGIGEACFDLMGLKAFPETDLISPKRLLEQERGKRGEDAMLEWNRMSEENPDETI